MNLAEYREQIIADTLIASSSRICYPEDAFLSLMVEVLETIEEISDFQESYFIGKGNRNRNLQFDGYSFDYADKTFSLLITDYVDSENEETITNSQIDSLSKKMQFYLEAVFSGYIVANLEHSSPGYEVACDILEYVKRNELIKFKFYIVTNKQISKRVNKVKLEPINGIPIELNVWDINRFYEIAKSNMAKETIIVKTSDFGYNEGIPSLKANISDSSEYQSYLSVISGDLLAKLYIEYGARLLEGNVRSFLSVRGKVNKSIRRTLLNEQEKFFAFNNGIAATATSIKTTHSNEGVFITEIENFQIINGGQTTASIANVVLNDKKDVKDVFVPMKLSIVTPDEAETIIPLISRSANTQNKVDEADFFSNSPFHIRFEEFSRKTYTPIKDGVRTTLWFYERARGQHVQEQMKLTNSQRKEFLLKNPKNQVVKKVDLAKFLVTSWGYPHEVSKGAQSNMKFFAKSIEKQWEKDDSFFNVQYYRNSIAWAIIFKETEKLVSQQSWYQEIKSYRANIVTYSIAILNDFVDKKVKGKMFDLKKVWNSQTMYDALVNQLIITTKEVYDYITNDSRPTLNVTEWCKKEACWSGTFNVKWTISEEFKNTLVSKSEMLEEENDARREQRQDNDLALEMKVVLMGSKYWENVANVGKTHKLISISDMRFLSKAISFERTGKTPSTFEAQKLLEIRSRLIIEGLLTETNI